MFQQAFKDIDDVLRKEAGCSSELGYTEQTAAYRLATFSADVAVPIGQPLMGGGIAPAREITDPLLARAVALLGAGITMARRKTVQCSPIECIARWSRRGRRQSVVR